jgi:cobyrinic acid a,c-diamide synthase
MRAIPRLVLGGVSSGVGKTTTTIAIARALRARGMRVALFKCGPDYLDPTYHARAIGAASHNLDGWMMGRAAVLATFARASEGADIAIIEGVMGLFDGASPTGEEGSTAEIAKWLDAPVALIADASGMARSIAAIAQGFAAFDPAVRVATVIANRVGSRGHLDLLKKALRTPPVLGGFPKEEADRFPERHLGLRTADESTLPDALLDRWGARAEEWLAIDALVDVARSAPPLASPAESIATSAQGARCRIGLAFDEAFHFYYEDNLRRLEQLGAEIVRFSPMREARLPAVDGLYLGGGYPEAHAEALAQNEAMRAEIARFADRGGAIYAECGGLMYLTRAIVTQNGTRHAMVGVVPAEAVMCDRLQALGYVEVETQEKTILGPAGLRFRGHQFRYSELRDLASDVETVYTLRKRRGGEVTREGYRAKNVLASYVHAHWASNPLVPQRFVETCAAYRDARGGR